MLRHAITLPLGDDEVELDVDFRLLALIERGFDMRAEYVAGLLELDHRIRRSQVADVIVAWIAERTDALAGRRRIDVLEEITTAPEETFRRYVGALQGAIQFSLRKITDEELEKLSRGEDLPPRQTDDADSKKKSASPNP